MTSKGKRLTYLIVALGVFVLLVAGYAFKDKAVEQWYLWQLESEDEQDRDVATQKLGEMRSVRAVPWLVEIFRREDSVPYEFGRSAEALIRIGAPAAPAVSQLSEDKNSSVRLKAVSCLESIIQNTKSSPVLRTVLPAIIGRFADENTDVRTAAMSAVGEFEWSAVPDLIKALESNREELRIGAATSIGNIAFIFFGMPRLITDEGTVEPLNVPAVAKSAVSSLTNSLSDSSPSVRSASAEALYWFDYDEFGGESLQEAAASKLIEMLEDVDNEDVSVRKEAARALGGIRAKKPRAVPALIHTLRDSEVEVRREAAGALPYFRKDKDSGLAVVALTQALTDKEPAVRNEVADALGRFRSAAQSAVLALKTLLTTERDEAVRKAAAEALKEIQGDSATIAR